MSPPPLNVPTTQHAFVEKQSTICRFPSPPKIWGKKSKATTKVTLRTTKNQVTTVSHDTLIHAAQTSEKSCGTSALPKVMCRSEKKT